MRKIENLFAVSNGIFLTILLYLLTATILILVTNAQSISDRIFSNSQVVINDNLVEIAQTTDKLLNIFKTVPISATLISILLWALIGIGLYIVTQTTFNEVSDLSNDISTIEHSIFSKKKGKMEFIKYTIYRQLYRFVIYGSIGIWIILAISVFLPFSSSLFIIGLYEKNILSITAIGNILISIFVLASSFAVLGFLFKVRKVQ